MKKAKKLCVAIMALILCAVYIGTPVSLRAAGGSGITVPKFDASSDTNVLEQTVLLDSAGTAKAFDSGMGVNYTDTESRITVRYGFAGLKYGKSYCFSAKAKFQDNKSMTPWNCEQEYNFEGLRFQVATAKKDGVEYKIEVGIRKGLFSLFANAKGADTAFATVFGKNNPYDTENLYSIRYRENNRFDFFQGDTVLFDNYDLTTQGYTDIQPCIGVGGEVCAFSFRDMKLWGDIKVNRKEVPEIPVEAIFDADADINLMEKAVVSNPSNGKVGTLDNCALETDKSYTASGCAEIKGLVYGNSYNFSTKAAFYDNKTTNSNGSEVNWEGLVFRVATVEKDGKTHKVEVRFRKSLVGVFVDNTAYALNSTRGTAYGSENQYTVSYHANGTFSVFQNGIAIYWKYDITKEGYTNVQPTFAFGGEACAFGYQNMKLWGNISLAELPGVPKKPASNGNYGDYMRVSSGSTIKYEDGKIYSTTDETAGRSEFQYLPFGVDDTYVFGFHINTKKAEKAWMGPRILFGKISDGRELALFIMKSSMDVYAGTEKIKSVSFGRNLNQVYRVDLLIEPEAVSVWVDDVLLIDKCKLPKKSEVKTGILFENAIAVMSHIDLYYTDEVEFVAPDIPEPPVLKKLSDGQYNAADWMKVTLNGKKYDGYFGNKLSSNNSSVGNRYLYENLPITDDMSYYYSATYTVTESSAGWKGPRFIFRYDDNNAFYVAILQSSVVILAGADQVASTPLKLQLGKDYDIVMYSTPTEISVWIDDVLIFESVDLTPYITTKLSAKPGIVFEMCQAKLTNLAIYGDKIVFDERYVDPELYYSKYYKMAGVPAMTGLNLFQNITMTDSSKGAIGAEFDAEQNILTTAYTNGSGLVTFTDANGSNNLNGLKNESEYVFAFKYQVDDWEAEDAGKSGFWVTTNASVAPWTKKSNTVRVGFSGDALMLTAYKEDKVITDQQVSMNRVDGKVYDVAIVHGKNWIKLYVDNELKLVSTELPTYNIAFRIYYSNAKSKLSDIKLYEFEDSGLKILETRAEQEVSGGAGNTIYNAKEITFYSRIKTPIAVIAAASVVILLSLAGIIVLVVREGKRRKIKAEMGGEAS